MNLTTYMLKKLNIALFVATFLMYADSMSANLAGPFYSYYPWSFTNNYSIITGKTIATVNFSALPSTSSTTLTVKTPGIRQWSDFGLIDLNHNVNQKGCAGKKTPCDCNH